MAGPTAAAELWAEAGAARAYVVALVVARAKAEAAVVSRAVAARAAAARVGPKMGVLQVAVLVTGARAN